MVVLSCHVLCCFKKMSWRQGTLKGNVVHLDLRFLNLESPSLHGHICQAPHLDGVIWWGTYEGEAGQKCVETSHKKCYCIAFEGGAFTSSPPYLTAVWSQHLSIAVHWRLDHVSLVVRLIQTMAYCCPQTCAYYLICCQYHSSARSKHMSDIILSLLRLTVAWENGIQVSQITIVLQYNMNHRVRFLENSGSWK